MNDSVADVAMDGAAKADPLSLYRSLENGPQSILLVVAFGALFLLMEVCMTHSPIANKLANLLRSNPKLEEKEVKKCVPMVVTRIVGFIHNAVQVPIAVWVICNPALRADRFYATHPVSHWMLCCAGGFFLHDAISCFFRESPFYIVHGLTCCLGYATGAAYGCGHFYGGLFLMWECSTPFVQLRWVLYKMGRTETQLYKVNGVLMVLTFGIARILFGTYFTGLLLSDTYRELTGPPKAGALPPAIPVAFCGAALTISTLNYYWFGLMMRSMLKVLRGHTWTDISNAKQE